MTLPDPSAPEAPKYWMYEQGGELGPAMLGYLKGDELSIRDLRLIAAYLRQWVDSPAWDANPALSAESRQELATLRQKTASARTKAQIDESVSMAVDMGMDPL